MFKEGALPALTILKCPLSSFRTRSFIRLPGNTNKLIDVKYLKQIITAIPLKGKQVIEIIINKNYLYVGINHHTYLINFLGQIFSL